MDDLTRQIVRAMRGTDTAAGFSRRLGYRTNVVAKWERGRTTPTLGDILRAASRLGVDVPAALSRFHRPASAAFDPARPRNIHRWLAALVGDTPYPEVARRAGLSRYQVGRLLRGDANGRLPDALALVDGATGRVVELIGLLVDLRAIPALRDQVAEQRASVRWQAENRWGPAVVAVLCTLPPGASRSDAVRWLGDRLPLDPETAERELLAAIDAGAVHDEGDRITVHRRDAVPVPTLETDQRTLRHHWATEIANRTLDPGPNDVTTFETLAVTRADLARIQALQRAYLRDVRAIAAASTPAETAALVMVATVTWSP